MADYQIRRCERQLEGGIHLETHKGLSTTDSCVFVDDPKRLIFPIHFSGGGPGEALVTVGDAVSQGTPIIKCQSGITHFASRAGTVIDITDHAVMHPSAIKSASIIIEPNGLEDQNYLDPLAWPFDADTLRHRAFEAGILSLGGAGFPSFKNWSDGTQTLIINGAECEPYLTADDTLMRIDTNSMIRGACMLSQSLDIKTIIIGIEDNKPEALEAIESALKESRSDCYFDIVLLDTKYPSGSERHLVWLTLGIEVPTGSRAVESGVIVHNPGTLAALSHAIDGKPITDRIVTLTGEVLAAPQNIIVPIGAPISHLIEATDTNPESLTSITVGGPMMGYSVTNFTAGITKTTNCLLAREVDIKLESPCIRCGACATVCPVRLQPQQMVFALKGGSLDRAIHEGLTDCIECAACNAVCPSHIPLAEWFRLGRFEARDKANDQRLAAEARERFEARNMRLERIALEKEAKRTVRQAKTADALEKARKARKESA
ncbi:MAG: electron transport complex subunit RsxC [Pseudomonadota bacterium]|nr:electron transport complex subunit RsxC [Pseudomonadota bacterium]MEE2820696.1 electron transport complex subunit RsxC [Pseudomonadota bacterium]